MPIAPSPHQNHLLDALPRGEYERVASHLELVPLQLGDVLYESGVNSGTSIFPRLHRFAALCHGIGLVG